MVLKYNSKLTNFAKKLRNHSTKSEIRLWNYLKNRKLKGYKFNRQKPLGNFIADFYCHKLCLVIEIDGSSHNSIKSQEKDRNKEEYFKSIGLHVLRFTGYEVFENIEGVIQAIQNYIDEFETRKSL